MGVIDDILEANRQAAGDVATSLGATPARGVAIVTCMDARVDPWRAFGLACGDAHVIRNAGGRVTDDVVRSLAASWHFLDTTAVMVVHHSSCGMYAPDPEQPRRQLAEATGEDVSDLDLLTFEDEEGSVRDDVERVRTSPLLPEGAEVRGFIYDLESGLLREV